MRLAHFPLVPASLRALPPAQRVHILVAHGHAQRVIEQMQGSTDTLAAWLMRLPECRRRAHAAYVLHQMVGRCHPLRFPGPFSPPFVPVPAIAQVLALLAGAALALDRGRGQKEEDEATALHADIVTHAKRKALTELRAVVESLGDDELALTERDVEPMHQNAASVARWCLPVDEELAVATDAEAAMAVEQWSWFLVEADASLVSQLADDALDTFQAAIGAPLLEVAAADRYLQGEAPRLPRRENRLGRVASGLRRIGLAREAAAVLRDVGGAATSADRAALGGLADVANDPRRRTAMVARWARGRGRSFFPSLPAL